jgi:hypothetical protein
MSKTSIRPVSQIKLFEFHFHIPKAFSFVLFDSKIIGHGNPDNNLESLGIFFITLRITFCVTIVLIRILYYISLSRVPKLVTIDLKCFREDIFHK